MSSPQGRGLECDIVMKGGITSGVIYPMAVVELAKTYRLRSVGGASAGAIAAAAAAAAEFGRASGGFDRLAALPDDLTEVSNGKSRLFGLFQPTDAAYPLYRVFTAGMGAKHPIPAVLAAVLTSFWFRAITGALLGIIVIAVCATQPASNCVRVLGIAAGVVVALLGVVVGIALSVVKILKAVPKAGFGLCTGMEGFGSGNADALTPWLHAKLQHIAGPDAYGPLTFGALKEKDRDHAIVLKTMTTNLTRSEPMAMPWKVQEYFFDPEEMRKLFPKDVVDWMEKKPPANGPDGKKLSEPAQWDRDLLWRQAETGPVRLLPFPAPDDVPIVVATRMSLSFPLLITAVRLHAVNYNLVHNRVASDAVGRWRAGTPGGTVEDALKVDALRPRFDANWFSDGGICSNLPVHFFDAPLPTRPTFALDLASFPDGRIKDKVDEANNVYLPLGNTGGLLRPWAAMPTDGVKDLGTFFSRIVDTARGWVDAAQLGLPGYRDRIVTIYHDDTEGGMNLNMPASRVTALSKRGKAAGAKLVTKFAGTPEGKPQGWGWDNNRWIRFRTATAGLQAWLHGFNTGYTAPSPGATPYSDLAGQSAGGALPSYRLTVAEREAVNRGTGDLLGLAVKPEWSGDAMLKAVPKPSPRMRLVPDDGSASGLTKTGDAPEAAPIPLDPATDEVF